MPRLVVEAVSYSRGSQLIIDNLSFELAAGELLSITGQNGAGKTTLLKLIAGLLVPEQGSVSLRHADNGVIFSPQADHQAWLGHRNALKDAWTGLENLQFLRQLRVANDFDPLQALSMVGLFKQRHQTVQRFSQGMKRRLALASLLLSSAPLWLLDEPQNSLDKEGIALFEQMLARHLDAGGLAVMASHHALSLTSPNCRYLTLGTRA